MRHATQLALWLIWTGQTTDDLAAPMAMIDRPGNDELPIARFGCLPTSVIVKPEAMIPASLILGEIPTCPRCAVLYDEAMTAREEFLGRQAA
jgi:hypothetical protein